LLSDPNFLTALNEVLETHQIDIIIPAHDSVCLALSKAAFEKTLKADAPSILINRLSQFYKGDYDLL